MIEQQIKPQLPMTACYAQPILSVKKRYSVHSIDNNCAIEWLLKKHYAKRLPIMEIVFGLFDENNIQIGVCVCLVQLLQGFGIMGANYLMTNTK